MRRPATGLILAGLAACCLASAVLLGWHIEGQTAQRLPGGHETATLTATRASYVSPTRLTEITGADLAVTETISQVTGTGLPAIDIWDVRTSAYDTTNHQQLEPVSRTIVFDRRTAELINCCGGNINGDALIHQAGIAGWAFPVGTGKQKYYVFDTVLGKPEPFLFSGTGTVDGIAAYQFTQDISGANAGFSPLSSTDPERYSMYRVYWVDPETGMPIEVTENEDLYLVNPTTGSVVTHLFRADLRTTPTTVARLASQDARDRGKIALAASVRLVLSGMACVLALIAGCLLARGPCIELLRRRRPARSPGVP